MFPFTILETAHGHGAMVSPRSRNSVDYLVDVNTQKCSNITGDACNNGQASFGTAKVASLIKSATTKVAVAKSIYASRERTDSHRSKILVCKP